MEFCVLCPSWFSLTSKCRDATALRFSPGFSRSRLFDGCPLSCGQARILRRTNTEASFLELAHFSPSQLRRQNSSNLPRSSVNVGCFRQTSALAVFLQPQKFRRLSDRWGGLLPPPTRHRPL